jgi:hypothetical protein
MTGYGLGYHGSIFGKGSEFSLLQQQLWVHSVSYPVGSRWRELSRRLRQAEHESVNTFSSVAEFTAFVLRRGHFM